MDNRNVISIGLNPVTLKLKELRDDIGAYREFEINEYIGKGTSSCVYKAIYYSGGMKHTCILKELYPENCGLVRNPHGQVLEFSSSSDDIGVTEKSSYDIIRKKYIEAYRIQLDMNQGKNSIIKDEDTYLDERMMMSLGISTPIGLYENENGILYSIYDVDEGIDFEKFGNEKLQGSASIRDIISLILQTANLVNAFHQRGYFFLDIKESNMLITGGSDHRTAVLFDFGSFVRKEELKNLSFEDGHFSFSLSSEEYMCPYELHRINNHFQNEKYSTAKILIQKLSSYADKTDIYLLAAILYKRLFGKAPDTKIITKGQNWELPIDNPYHLSAPLREILKNIFSNTLLWKDPQKRYTMEKFIADMRNLYALSPIDDQQFRDNATDAGIDFREGGVSAERLRMASRRHHDKLGEVNNKFYNLSTFSKRHNCQICVKGTGEEHLKPSDVLRQNDYVFLQGDGGMGKSTTVYDYWTEMITQQSKTCIYIDLSRFVIVKENKQRPAETPVSMLAYVGANILCKYGDFPDCSDPENFLNQPYALKFMNTITNLFTKKTNEKEFVLIADGYNEIIDQFDREMFKKEMNIILESWGNVSVIITSRSVEETERNDYNSTPQKNSLFDTKLRMFNYIGVPDEEVEQTLISETTLSADRVEELKKDSIWSILKIPMFLNMYCKLNDYSDLKIHTRGELIDRYVMQSESQVAERNSDTGKKDDLIHANRRRFITWFSLPFVANYMDSNKLSAVSRSTLNGQVTNGNLLYLMRRFGKKRMPVYDYLTSGMIAKVCIGFDEKLFEQKKREIQDLNEEEGGDTLSAAEQRYEAMQEMLPMDEVLQILKIETGFCYDTTDGEIAFTHQYFRDYFAAKHIQNILRTAQTLGDAGLSKDEQLQFTINNGLDYIWSDDVCRLLGEIEEDYKNEPGYME